MQITSDALSLDYAKVEVEIIRFIQKVVSGARANGTVVGLSGGIDSSVVGAMCVRALGKEKVVGILMPASHTPKKDMEDARILAEGWGVKTFEVRIDPIFSALVRALPLRGDDKIAKANAKARIRMIINYYFANRLGMVVAGTGDRAGDQIRYFTKWGGGGGDFLPIAHPSKTQVGRPGAPPSPPPGVGGKPSSPHAWP